MGMKSPTTDYSNADNFYMPMFSGKTFSVDIDFQTNGPSCGCNLNFYLVGMPWPTEGKDHDHYCDAQCFPGLGCCAEFDMNEGNMEVQQITNHACTRDYSSHPDWQCHKWGDPEAKTHSSDFGPGADYTIDSGRPFTFSQRFDVNGDDFLFTTVISQDGNQVVRQMGPGSSQLNAMLKEIQKGMVFVTGYWFAPDMNWMDGELCGNGPEHCNMNPVYISNWRLTTNSGPAHPHLGRRRPRLPQEVAANSGQIVLIAAMTTQVGATSPLQIARPALEPLTPVPLRQRATVMRQLRCRLLQRHHHLGRHHQHLEVAANTGQIVPTAAMTTPDGAISPLRTARSAPEPSMPVLQRHRAVVMRQPQFRFLQHPQRRLRHHQPQRHRQDHSQQSIATRTQLRHSCARVAMRAPIVAATLALAHDAGVLEA